MTVCEPLVSTVAYSPGYGWGAVVTDSANQQPEDFDVEAWDREMCRAYLLLVALGNQPRVLTIVHPHGYRGESS